MYHGLHYHIFITSPNKRKTFVLNMKQNIKISKLTVVSRTALLYKTEHPSLLWCCFGVFLLKKKETKGIVRQNNSKKICLIYVL